MCIISWTIDLRMNIQIWLLYRRYKSEWYNFWWATIQDIAACACKVWTLFGQACGQEECSQTTMTTMTTDKSWLHRLVTDILSWAKNQIIFLHIVRCTPHRWGFRSGWYLDWLWFRLTFVQMYPPQRHLVAKCDTTLGQVNIWSDLQVRFDIWSDGPPIIWMHTL